MLLEVVCSANGVGWLRLPYQLPLLQEGISLISTALFFSGKEWVRTLKTLE